MTQYHKDLVIIGNGGHAEVVIDACHLIGVKVRGLVSNINKQLFGIHTIGDDELLNDPNFLADNLFFIGIGENRKRKELFLKLEKNGGEFVSIVHPKAVVSTHAVIAQGSFIAAGSVIQTGAQIGKNCIVNTGAQIDHHCIVGNHCHVAPNATLAGNVVLGDGVFVGMNSCIVENTVIGENFFIKAHTYCK